MGSDWQNLRKQFNEAFPELEMMNSCTICDHVGGWCQISSPADTDEEIFVIYCKGLDKPVLDPSTIAESCPSFKRKESDNAQ